MATSTRAVCTSAPPSARVGRSAARCWSSSSPSSSSSSSSFTRRCPRRRRRSIAIIAAGEGETDDPENARRRAASSPSSWDATERGALDGEDYLYELGRRSASVSTEVGARKGRVDDVFAGTANARFNLGADADIASGALRYNPEVRSLSNVVDGCYVPPRFLDRVALHVAKNHLAADDPDGSSSSRSSGAFGSSAGGLGPVPLILGIWGEKGGGKSYTLELCLRALNATPIIMSAGELEDRLAGEPGRLVRERYRKASRVASQTGKLACLVINDLDAGAGAFRATQRTVNMQMVVGTLMNLCDHPHRASVGGEWIESERLRRVPIIVTGNDLSTLYAPLLRDGRMDKFLWAPTREEKIAAVHAVMGGVADEEGADASSIGERDVAALVDAFPNQPMDFFGAVHARTVDDAVRRWIRENGGVEGMGRALLGGDHRARAAAEANARRATGDEDGLGATVADRSRSSASVGFWERGRPSVRPRGVTLERLLAIAKDVQDEQERVMTVRLVEEYMPKVKNGGVREADAFAETVEAERARLAAERADAAKREARARATEASEARARAAREALARATRENPREMIELISPAERAARAQRRREADTAERVASGAGGGSGWTILDGGVTTEKSVTEKDEWAAFDDMDWG